MQYFHSLVLATGSAAMSLDWQKGAYWARIFLHASQLMREHSIALKPVWWQSAAELRTASLELYLRFLDGIDCRVNDVKPDQCSGFPNTWNFPGWQDVCEAIPIELEDKEHGAT